MYGDVGLDAFVSCGRIWSSLGSGTWLADGRCFDESLGARRFSLAVLDNMLKRVLRAVSMYATHKRRRGRKGNMVHVNGHDADSGSRGATFASLAMSLRD